MESCAPVYACVYCGKAKDWNVETSYLSVFARMEDGMHSEAFRRREPASEMPIVLLVKAQAILNA